MISFFNTGNAKYDKIFFDFDIKDINEETFALDKLKDKTVLLVNVASNCGFTKQYSELQELYDKYSEKGLVVLGVPSNQFGGQEPGSNNEIKDFCETNFNITFPMTTKIDVKGENAHPIYLWAKENLWKRSCTKVEFS
jgi:glutathione peroxidase